MKKVIPAVIFLALWTAGVVWATLNINSRPQTKKEEAQVVDPKVVPDSLSKLRTRFVLDAIDQATLMDLDNDGEGESLVISHYADTFTSVFIYYGLYKFSPQSNLWEEIHADRLNILSIPPELYADKVDDPQEFKRKFIQVFATNLSQMRNVGDLTGDGYPEVLVTTRFQGKTEKLYYRVVGLGPDNFRYLVAESELPFGTVDIKEKNIVETYKNLETDQFMKVIKAWDSEKLFFIKNYEELAPPPSYERAPDQPVG